MTNTRASALTPEASSALTQAEVLLLTGERFSRGVWTDLSLHAPEEDLRALLRHALQNGLQFASLTLPIRGEESANLAALDRLGQIAEQLHLAQPDVFDRQAPALHITYHERRAAHQDNAAGTILTDFAAILAQDPRDIRLSVLRYLLDRARPPSGADHRALCGAAARVMLRTVDGRIHAEDRRQMARTLLLCANPRWPGAIAHWEAMARRLQLDTHSFIQRSLASWPMRH